MCYFDIWSRFVVLFFSPSGKGSALLPALWFKLQPNTSGHIHAHTSRRQCFLLLQLQPQSWSSSPCFPSPSGEGKSLKNIGEIRISNEQNISVSFKSDCVPNNEKEILSEHSFHQLMYSALVQNWNCSLLTHLTWPAVMKQEAFRMVYSTPSFLLSLI